MKWDMQAQAQLGRTLDAIQHVTKRKLPQIIKQTTFYFVRSAVAATPKTKSGRRRRIRVAKKGETKGAKYVMEVWKQGRAKPALLPTNRKDDPRAKIRYAGAARAGWLATYRYLGGKARKQPAHIEKVGRKANLTMHRLTGDKPFVLTANWISYIQTIAPMSAALGIARANNQMAHKYLPELSNLWQVQWRKWQ